MEHGHAGGNLPAEVEAAVRAAKEAATTASTSRFVPVTLPTAKASYPLWCPPRQLADTLRSPSTCARPPTNRRASIEPRASARLQLGAPLKFRTF